VNFLNFQWKNKRSKLSIKEVKKLLPFFIPINKY